MVEDEYKLNQLEEKKEQLRDEMVQKTNLLVFRLDREEQDIRRENILIHGVEQNKEDNDDGEKVLFKIADELEIDLKDNEIDLKDNDLKDTESTSTRTKNKKQWESTHNHCKICVIQKKKRVSY